MLSNKILKKTFCFPAEKAIENIFLSANQEGLEFQTKQCQIHILSCLIIELSLKVGDTTKNNYFVDHIAVMIGKGLHSGYSLNTQT